MRCLAPLLTVAMAASGVVASSWFPGSKAIYNKWHETELERWLSDHEIPYPTPADRKDLESLVEKNWNDLIIEPYNKWDTARLSSYLKAKGKDARADADEAKDSLVSQVKANWYETEEATQNGWANVKDWILDTWTESQLKSFCDKHGIPVPQPRHRDTILQKARSAYETAARKAGETASYPGNWLYASWSESDLKSWLAYLNAQSQAASASASAQAAYATLTDMIIDAWSESQLKDFADKNGIPVPQGTRVNELRALLRKHRAEFLGDTVGASAKSAFGAATSNARNEYAKATDSASLAAQDAFNQAVGLWSESRLKAYLDARGVPVPQRSSVDDLRALVRKHSHKAASGWTAWTFDDFSRKNLEEYLSKHGDKAARTAAKKKDASRDDLVKAAQSAYSSASTAGGATYASATSYISSATAAAKDSAFDSWSHSDLKAYLDSYGVPVPQGSKIDELRALARRQSTYFKHGTSSPGGTIFAKIEETAREGWNWISHQLNLGSQAAQEKAAEAEAVVKAKAKQAREELSQDRPALGQTRHTWALDPAASHFVPNGTDMEEVARKHFFHHGKDVSLWASCFADVLTVLNHGSPLTSAIQQNAHERDACHWCQLRQFPSHLVAPVTVVNDVDDQILPRGFRFIDKSVLGTGVTPADESFRSGCNCWDSASCQFAGCQCLAELDEDIDSDDGSSGNERPGTGGDLERKAYAYHTHGAKAGLLRSKLYDSKIPLYECHQGCSCASDCPNRVVERGRTISLQIFRTEDRGWGVRTQEALKKGQFVDRYLGEIITSVEADRRRDAAAVSQRKDVYLFALDKFTDPDSLDPRLRGPPLEVDGEFMSGPTRFINHSCEPNLRIFARVGDHADKHLHDLALFAIRDIQPGEELTFDYVDGVSQDPDDEQDGMTRSEHH
ncbi:stress response protein (Ish1) [Purpureocillium lavendulum]|uniref:Stress response protein (Ish1) n=1 Tax=Purpureocillium lavendulum TaxID=1247861 RepID=A0AB34G3K0_9HYPO|nr:stress response protein (Ish1) [Purpureocillium lavendulum]